MTAHGTIREVTLEVMAQKGTAVACYICGILPNVIMALVLRDVEPRMLIECAQIFDTQIAAEEWLRERIGLDDC